MPSDEVFPIIRLDPACPAVRPLTCAPVRGVRTVNETEADVVRRVFGEFPAGAIPRAITGRPNGQGVPGTSGKLWSDPTIRGHAERDADLITSELHICRLGWNRLGTQAPGDGKAGLSARAALHARASGQRIGASGMNVRGTPGTG